MFKIILPHTQDWSGWKALFSSLCPWQGHRQNDNDDDDSSIHVCTVLYACLVSPSTPTRISTVRSSRTTLHTVKWSLHKLNTRGSTTLQGWWAKIHSSFATEPFISCGTLVYNDHHHSQLVSLSSSLSQIAKQTVKSVTVHFFWLLSLVFFLEGVPLYYQNHQQYKLKLFISDYCKSITALRILQECFFYIRRDQADVNHLLWNIARHLRLWRGQNKKHKGWNCKLIAYRSKKPFAHRERDKRCPLVFSDQTQKCFYQPPSIKQQLLFHKKADYQMKSETWPYCIKH